MLHNIILAEKASMSFQAGLNIITGETGSGKSAVMHGLCLAIGERADAGFIRSGCEKGVVEAVFEIQNPAAIALLEEGGIDHEQHHELVIRREISASGKGRIFINNQMAQLSFLKKLGPFLVQISGQHANHGLLTSSKHREAVDLYANLQALIEEFQKSFQAEKIIRNELNVLIQGESSRLREMDALQSAIEEIEVASLKEGEEEELFQEFSILSNATEVSSKLEEINQSLSGERLPLLSILNKQKNTLSSLVSFDPSLKNVLESFENVLVELQEISHTLFRYQTRVQADPKREAEIDARLSLINKLKRKYGKDAGEILLFYSDAKKKLDLLENADREIQALKEGLEAAEKRTHLKAAELTAKRKESALFFEEHVTSHLQSLNMPKALFKVVIDKQARTEEGDDRVEFFLCPNVGEQPVPLKEGASGGEIARVMLALQALLAGKGNTSTLVLDEIDANIGGETAAVVANKLREIGKKHQVICITHFPQVASQADHHLQISKEEKEGRTITVVQELNSFTKEKELARMAGRVYTSKEI